MRRNNKPEGVMNRTKKTRRRQQKVRVSRAMIRMPRWRRKLMATEPKNTKNCNRGEN